MRYTPYGPVPSVPQIALVRTRVADAIRGSIELLEASGGCLDAWQVHHLTMAAMYGRMGIYETAAAYIDRAAASHAGMPELSCPDGSKASLDSLRTALIKLERAA